MAKADSANTGRLSWNERAALRLSLQEAYRDLQAPQRRFVLDRSARNPYTAQIAEAARLLEAVFEEDTDVNCDVCFTYYVTPQRDPGRPLILRLSMIGPYAVLVAVDVTTNHSVHIGSERDCLSAQEVAIYRWLTRHYRFLDADELAAVSPVEVDGAPLSFYAALFEFEAAGVA